MASEAAVKVTLRLRGPAKAALDELVGAGVAKSRNQLVEILLLREHRAWERKRKSEERRRVYQQAMADPAYVADHEAVLRDFAPLDAETWESA